MTATLPILAIPGTLCDSQLFEPLESALGRSFDVAECHHFRTTAEAAAGVLARAPSRFIALGFSLGGWVALELLRLAPERVAAVILLSGNAFPDDPENEIARRGSVKASRDGGMETFFRYNYPRFVGDGALRSVDLRPFILAMAERVGHDAHERQVEMNIARPDLLAIADNSTVPILIVAGGEDRLCPRVRYERTAAGPRVQLAILPGIGHFLPLEAPSMTAAVVNEFLKGVRL